MAVLKGVGDPRTLTGCVGAGQGAGLAGRRAHPDGDRVGGHASGLPSLHGRTRTVHGAQRLVRQPRHHPAPTAFRRNRLRQRERHRSGRAVHRQATGRRPRRRVRAEGTLRDVRRLLHAAGVQQGLVRGGPRCHRVQARRDRRDRRLGGGRQRIPRAGRTSRCRERHHLGAGAGGDLRVEHGSRHSICATPRCGMSTPRCMPPTCRASSSSPIPTARTTSRSAWTRR